MGSVHFLFRTIIPDLELAMSESMQNCEPKFDINLGPYSTNYQENNKIVVGAEFGGTHDDIGAKSSFPILSRRLDFQRFSSVIDK
jgi:hypothetical protein